MAIDYSLEVLAYIRNKHILQEDKSRKDKLTNIQISNMFKRTSRMFRLEPKNDKAEQFLRDNPQNLLELQVQVRGLMGVVEKNGKYYMVRGSLGGIPTHTYMPSKLIVTNPYLNLASYEFDIYGENKNCVVIPNDTLYEGLISLISYHCEMLTEIELTKLLISMCTRSPVMATAPDNNAKKDIDGFFADLTEGKIKSVYDKNFMKSIGAVSLNPNSSHNVITQILEMQQYEKASLFNDIGLQMNYNMKRETITSSEAQLGEGSLLPLCDDMYECRKKAYDELRELWGIDLDFDFASSWKDMRQSIENEIQKEKNEAEQTEEQEESSTVEPEKEEKENEES